MKKQFLTLALLATVAVGGVFAGSSVAPRPGAPFNSSGPCGASLKTCSDIVSDICTIEIEGDIIPLYDNTSAPGTCTVPLYTCL